MGAGKSSVLSEASDLRPAMANDGFMYRNLESLCRNYDAAGVARLLLARTMENRAELELCRKIVSTPNVVVCRLTAELETMEQRIKTRESGLLRQQYIARAAKLNAILEEA